MNNTLGKGWIKLYRKFIDWQWYTNINVKTLFLHLLLVANIKDKSWQNITVKRGQYITSIQNLSKETGLSEQQVRTSLKKLESSNEILRKSTNKYTCLTLCNYNTYQDSILDCNKQITNEQQTNNKQVTTTKEVKNKDIYIHTNKRFQKPTVEEIENYISEYIEKSKKYSISIDAEHFFNYYESNGWKVGKNPMKDWQATAKNWIRKENENGGDNGKQYSTNSRRNQSAIGAKRKYEPIGLDD